MDMEKINDFSLNRDETIQSVEPEEVIEDVVEDSADDEEGTSTNSGTKKEKQKSSNFDSLFDNLYSDVAGANNFITNLIEQKKKVGVNEAYLEEEKTKLDSSRHD